MAMEIEMQLIKKMEKNDRAVRSNINELRKKYANQYIAVDNGKIISHDTSLENLRKLLEKNEKDLQTVLIEYIPEKGTVVLY